MEAVSAPLEDPAYDPVHKPVNGVPPDVVARWGPRSQVRWFGRFWEQLRPQRKEFWDRFYCSSEQHRGDCCVSCTADAEEGYRDWDEDKCCCKAFP